MLISVHTTVIYIHLKQKYHHTVRREKEIFVCCFMYWYLPSAWLDSYIYWNMLYHNTLTILFLLFEEILFFSSMVCNRWWIKFLKLCKYTHKALLMIFLSVYSYFTEFGSSSQCLPKVVVGTSKYFLDFSIVLYLIKCSLA